MKHLRRQGGAEEDSEDDVTPQHPDFGGARAVTGIDMFDDNEEIDAAPFEKQLSQGRPVKPRNALSTGKKKPS